MALEFENFVLRHSVHKHFKLASLYILPYTSQLSSTTLHMNRLGCVSNQTVSSDYSQTAEWIIQWPTILFLHSVLQDVL
jgi:hypothetical protein